MIYYNLGFILVALAIGSFSYDKIALTKVMGEISPKLSAVKLWK